MRFSTGFLLALLISPIVAFAETVTVYDGTGLIRAQKGVVGPVSMDVTLECAQGGGDEILVKLSNTDGLQEDIAGFHLGQCRYRLEEIADGAWKIVVTPDRVVLKATFLANNPRQ